MKITISILIILVFTVCAFGQAKKPPASKYVQVSATDDGFTSELLPMPIGMSPNLSGAEIGIKYFGVQSEGDISVVLILKGTKNRYSTNETFGVKLYSEDLPLSENKYRMIQSVRKDEGGEILQFNITSEEVAWLATGNSAKIEIYNSDTKRKYDTLSFTPTGFAEYKMFAKSVLLIRSFN
ncbi:MAG: hypothetical protein H0X72_01650 [Acidobacteria bacterium]|jgi:hypothetical protein|nr:hypothetical protein [Tatlockia sp.]MBA4121154.1 hypothetical protein [Acidobacteriota bacterium]